MLTRVENPQLGGKKKKRIMALMTVTIELTLYITGCGKVFQTDLFKITFNVTMSFVNFHS